MTKKASIDDYDALVLPGGVANPDALRMDAAAVRFVKDFVASGKPVAASCHAPWTLVEAGCTWVDDEVVTDGNLISSRNPGDLPAFNRALPDALQ